VQQLLECLETLGVARDSIFYQPDISVVDQENHWISQWLFAQRHSKVVVCLLSCAYLRSKPCCTEWKLIPEWQRLVVGIDTPVELLKTEITGFNGPPLAYVQCGEQMLDARTLTPAQIAAKILQKYELNKEKCHAYELRRGSPTEDELASAASVLAEGGDAVLHCASPSPEVAVSESTSQQTTRRLSISNMLKTPPLKFLIPSPSQESKLREGTPPKSARMLQKASSPSRASELDIIVLGRVPKEKERSWFG
jgi:hypothetical protein